MADWHPEDIKAAIRRQGRTLTALGAPAGVSRQAMSEATTIPHEAGERVIADFLDTEPHLIWPSRYDAAGERLSPQPAANYIRRPRFQTAEARA